MVRIKRNSRSAAAVLEPDELTLTETTLPAAEAGAFNPFDESIPGFRAAELIAESEWDGRYLLYLYRLDPKVKNPENEPAYIGCYNRFVDEDDVLREHGGGKYMFILKEDLPKDSPRQALQRRWKFRIDGSPMFQPGQTLMPGAPQVLPANGGPVSPAPAAGGESGSSTAELVKLLREMVRNPVTEQGNQAGLDMVAQANKAALEIVTSAAKQVATSSTGSSLGDKLLESMLPLLVKPHEPPKDPIRDRVVELALTRMLDPEPKANPDPLSQLGAVKELLGVDSIMDLISLKGGAGPSWQSELVKVGIGLVTQLPQLFQMMTQQQELNFRRQMQLIAMRRGQPAMGELPPVPMEEMPPSPVRGPIPVPPSPGVAQMPPPPVDVTAIALETIAANFEKGADGLFTAQVVRRMFPQVVDQLRPFLGDMNQVRLFCQNTSPLMELVSDSDFDEFLQGFVGEILTPTEDEAPAGEGGPPVN
jgi:hypothetical protein